MNHVLQRFIAECAHAELDPDQVSEMLKIQITASEEYFKVLSRLRESAIIALGGPVYTVRMVTPMMCDFLALKSNYMKFSPNKSEGDDYQIEEAILSDVAPILYENLKELLLPDLNDYSLMVYSRPIQKIVSMQIAKYTPDGTPGTGWHHDTESDVSCVISLNPGEFEGGGTGIRLSPNEAVEVPPLSKGDALFFNGKTIQHRGLPVTLGTRLLLVIWMST